MSEYSIRVKQTILLEEEQRRRLAECYALILSWSDIEKKTADRDEFGELAQPAAETPAQDEQGA